MKKVFLALFALMAVVAAPAQATITDDINPLGPVVYVELINNDSSVSKGDVEVTATVNGKPVTGSEPFQLAGNSQTTVAVRFKATVQDVIVVEITEGPDPID